MVNWTTVTIGIITVITLAALALGIYSTVKVSQDGKVYFYERPTEGPTTTPVPTICVTKTPVPTECMPVTPVPTATVNSTNAPF